MGGKTSKSSQIKKHLEYEMDAIKCDRKGLIEFFRCPPRLSSDVEVAKAVGCSTEHVSMVRKRNKIPKMSVRGNLIIENLCDKLLDYDYELYTVKKAAKKRESVAFFIGAGLGILASIVWYVILPMITT